MVYDEDDIHYGKISYFYFECKKCRERWTSTMGYYPKCKGEQKFKILSLEDGASEQMIQDIIRDRIHYIMLTGGE